VSDLHLHVTSVSLRLISLPDIYFVIRGADFLKATDFLGVYQLDYSSSLGYVNLKIKTEIGYIGYLPQSLLQSGSEDC
jgi:hypothetical protein